MTQPDLSNLATVTLIADANTPADLQQYAGKVIAFQTGQVMPAPGATGSLFGLPGTMLQGPDGLQWLMAAAPPPSGNDPGPVWAQQLVHAAVVATTENLTPILQSIQEQLDLIKAKLGA
jgi:hypothetical protein